MDKGLIEGCGEVAESVDAFAVAQRLRQRGSQRECYRQQQNCHNHMAA